MHEHLIADVMTIQPNDEAFAALKTNGDDVVWGSSISGGNLTAVAPKLVARVQSIHSTTGAFAAITKDGAIVTWGSPYCGGYSAPVQDQLASDVL